MLDGLNYIKDQLDGTLSFRWSCRMGICGSCGMMVNGDPQLTCATFLTDYAPGPVRVEPLANFPVIRDLVVDIDRLHAQAAAGSSRGSSGTRSRPVEATANTCRRPESWTTYKQFSMCINCMLCYAACPVYGLDPDVPRPGGDRAGAALQPGLPRRGRPGAARRALAARRHLGLHLRRRVHAGSAPSTSIPAAAIQRYKLKAAQGVGEGVPAARGVRDDLHRWTPGPTAGRDVDLVVAAQAVLLRVHAARAEQRLRRLVRGVPAAAGRAPSARGEAAYQRFLDWAAHRG